MFQPPTVPETQALTEFRENTAAVLKRLARSDRPLLLTQKGKAAGVVMSTKAYEQLADAASLAQSIAAVREGLKDFREGRARPAGEFFDELQRKRRTKPKKPRG